MNSNSRVRALLGLGAFAAVLLITLGVFASNRWLPATDPMTGKRSGWFGKPLAANAPSSWNPVAAVLPSPTPTPLPLSKEYIYAGSRLLAIEDANATAAPPADIAVWRPNGGQWWVMGQTGSAATYAQWGTNGDIPVPGDYDADGKTDFAIWRPSNGYWWIYFSSTSTYTAIHYGQNGDTPVPADYDGDGKMDIAVARPVPAIDNLEWYITYSGGGAFNGEFGLDNDIPGPADFDGDGRADFGVYRPSNDEYYWVESSTTDLKFTDLNNDGQTIVSSDYDGDGKADPAVFNTSTRYWYIYKSTTGSVYSEQWGGSGSIPVHNDYDLDGKTDLATWHGPSFGYWYIKRSSNGTTRTEQWGTTHDIPVPAFYRR